MTHFAETDVPRNALGWPVTDPSSWTENQLRREGERWRRTALETHSGIVGYEEWKKYASELHKRGFVEVLDPRIPLMDPESVRPDPVVSVDPKISKSRQWWIFGNKRSSA